MQRARCKAANPADVDLVSEEDADVANVVELKGVGAAEAKAEKPLADAASAGFESVELKAKEAEG